MRYGETKRCLVRLLFWGLWAMGLHKHFRTREKGRYKPRQNVKVVRCEVRSGPPMEWEALLGFLGQALIFQCWLSSRSLLLVLWPRVKWMKLPWAAGQHRLSTIVTERGGAVMCRVVLVLWWHNSLYSSSWTRHWKGRRSGCSVWSAQVWLPLCVFAHFQGLGFCTVCNQTCLPHLLSHCTPRQYGIYPA